MASQDANIRGQPAASSKSDDLQSLRAAVAAAVQAEQLQDLEHGDALRLLARTLSSGGLHVVLRTGLPLGTDDCRFLSTLRHRFLIVFAGASAAGASCGSLNTACAIVDTAFRSQFTVAGLNPTGDYNTQLVNLLPPMFVGPPSQLAAVVQIMAGSLAKEAGQQGVELAPWRSASALMSKWMPPTWCDEVFEPTPAVVLHPVLLASQAEAAAAATGVPAPAAGAAAGCTPSTSARPCAAHLGSNCSSTCVQDWASPSRSRRCSHGSTRSSDLDFVSSNGSSPCGSNGSSRPQTQQGTLHSMQGGQGAQSAQGVQGQCSKVVYYSSNRSGCRGYASPALTPARTVLGFSSSSCTLGEEACASSGAFSLLRTESCPMQPLAPQPRTTTATAAAVASTTCSIAAGSANCTLARAGGPASGAHGLEHVCSKARSALTQQLASGAVSTRSMSFVHHTALASRGIAIRPLVPQSTCPIAVSSIPPASTSAAAGSVAVAASEQRSGFELAGQAPRGGLSRAMAVPMAAPRLPGMRPPF